MRVLPPKTTAEQGSDAVLAEIAHGQAIKESSCAFPCKGLVVFFLPHLRKVAMSGIALNIQPYTPLNYVRSVQRKTNKLRAALAIDASPRSKLTKFPFPVNESRSIALADAPAIVEKTKRSVALVPPETLSRPDILEGNGSFAKPEVPSQGRDDDDEQLHFTDSESAPMSESEDETDDDVPSIKNMNDPIYKETITHHISTSSGESAPVS